MATLPEMVAVEQLHQAAQARLGIVAAYLALGEWTAVSSTNAVETGSVWLARSLRIIAAIRRKSRQLAISYYQLSRALETGRTLGVPDGSTAGNVTYGKLRENFLASVDEVAKIGDGKTNDPDPDLAWFEENIPDRGIVPRGANGVTIKLTDTDLDAPVAKLKRVTNRSDDNKKVKVDPFNWPAEADPEEVDKAYRKLLRKKALEQSAASSKAAREDESLSHDEAIKQIDDSHANAGSIGAGMVDEASISSGRDVIDIASRRDKLVRAVARGTSGNPCYFCAMLASRGFAYKSEATAGFGSDIKKYHPNCHCYPIVRWTRETELPELNAYFKEKWYEVTAGLTGPAMTKAWRHWWERERKKNLHPAPFRADEQAA